MLLSLSGELWKRMCVPEGGATTFCEELRRCAGGVEMTGIIGGGGAPFLSFAITGVTVLALACTSCPSLLTRFSATTVLLAE